MVASVGDTEELDSAMNQRQVSQDDPIPHSEEHLHHDRWMWRRKIRADPRKRAVYRLVIAALGTLLILLGFLTGPIPGPGGIPLVLLGLAIWGSEFHWARRLMNWFKLKLHQFRGWRYRQQTLWAGAIVLACWIVGYCYVLLIGMPSWLPQTVQGWIHRLPGI